MPKEKVQELISKICLVRDKKTEKLRHMQQLIGSLNFATRVIDPGRPFLHRLIKSTMGVNKPHHHLKVTNSMRQDLEMWLNFFKNYKGVSFS